jgi:hypothetical protein
VKTAALLLLVSAGWAQSLRVYSEFAQIDAAGRVTAPAEPREILSPAIARNAFSSFQVVVDVPQGTPYQLYVAQNPENAVEVTLYRENGDKLEKVAQPVSGNSTQVFWMDLWTARDAPVARIKVEPQLHVNNDWVIYPMEARVMEATVPDGPKPAGDETAFEVMQRFLCEPERKYDGYITEEYNRFQFRNAQQDVRLAAKFPRDEVRSFFGFACDAPAPSNPEEYLHIRDYLLRLR